MTDPRHPAPGRDQLSPWKAGLLLCAGPLAWFVQLCAGVAMTSWPCFPDMDRREVPVSGYEWTTLGALLLLLACAVLACLAAFLSWRVYRQVKEEREGGHDTLVALADGRTRFMALCGVYLGAGFGLATLVTLVGFAMVPRCLG